MSDFLSSLCILEISPLSDVGLVIFFHSVGLFLSYWLCPLLYRGFPVLGGRIYLLLLSVSVLLELYLGCGLLWPRIEGCFPLSLLSGSVWSDLYWGFLIHLDLSFVHGDRYGFIYILLQDGIQICQHHLLKILSFFHCIILASLSKSGVHRCVD